jgi:hypothetical protein
MHKVFFDSNTGSLTGGFLLYFDQSKLDLERMGESLIDGTEITIYDPGEFELDAILRYDGEYGCWRAVPTSGEIRYY